MGALFLVRRTRSGTADPRFQILRDAFRRHEWREPLVLSAAGCDLCVYPKRAGGAVSAPSCAAATQK